MSVASVIRISPNEEAAALKKRKGERRVTRILQVRQQEKGLANKMRTKVRVKKEAEKTVLDVRLQENLAHFQRTELLELETQLRAKVGELGEAHRAALKCMKEEYHLQNVDAVVKYERENRAQSRHKVALKELSASKKSENEDLHRHIEWKRKVRETEKKRAKCVASRKSSPPPVIMDLVVSKGHRVQFKDATSYASTYYHIPHTIVQKDEPEPDADSAQQVAVETAQEDAIISKQTEALKQEQHEKARMRFKYALAKVRLEKEKVQMMSELETLARSDIARRQKALAIMPKNLYQSTDRRLEMVSEQQQEMERAFEKLFVKKQSSFQRKPPKKKLPFVLPDSTAKDPSDHSSDSDSWDGRFLSQKPGFVPPPYSPCGGEPPTPSPSHPADSPRKKQVAFKSCAAQSSSSPSIEEDVSPISAQPVPVSPPKHPLNWSSSDTTTTTTTSSPSLDVTPMSPRWRDDARAKSPEMPLLIVTSPSKSTQTSIPTFQSFKGVTQGLCQPDLSVTDSAISSKKGDTGGAGISAFKPPKPVSASRHIKRTMDPSLPPHGRDAFSKKRPSPHRGGFSRRSLPKAKLPTESMEKLKSLVKAQQVAWEEQLKASEGVQATDKSKDFVEEQEEEEAVVLQQEFLSFSTLSTRDSTPALVDTASSKYPPLSRSITNSPAPLSISQYHTTLEESALSMGEFDQQNRPQSPFPHRYQEGKRSQHVTPPLSPVAHRREPSSKPFQKPDSHKQASPQDEMHDDHFHHRRSGSPNTLSPKSILKRGSRSPSPLIFQDGYRKYRSQSPPPHPLQGQARAHRQSSPLDVHHRHGSSQGPSPWPSPVCMRYHSSSPSTQPSDYLSRSPSAQPALDKKVSFNTTLEPSMSMPDLPDFTDSEELMVDAQPKRSSPSSKEGKLDFHRAKVDYLGLNTDLSMSPGTTVGFAPGGIRHAVQHRLDDSKIMPTTICVGQAVVDPLVSYSKAMGQDRHAQIAGKVRKDYDTLVEKEEYPESIAAVPMQQAQISHSHLPKVKDSRQEDEHLTPFIQARVEYETPHKKQLIPFIQAGVEVETKDLTMPTETSTKSYSSGESEDTVSSPDPSCSAGELPFQAPAKASKVEQPAALKQILKSALDEIYEDLAHPSLDVTSSSIPLECEEPLHQDQDLHAPGQPTSQAPPHPLFLAYHSLPPSLPKEALEYIPVTSAAYSDLHELSNKFDKETDVTNFNPLSEVLPTSPPTSTYAPLEPIESSIARAHPVLPLTSTATTSTLDSQPSVLKPAESHVYPMMHLSDSSSPERSTVTTDSQPFVPKSGVSPLQVSPPKLQATSRISPSLASISLTVVSPSPAVPSFQLSPPKIRAPFPISSLTSMGTITCNSDLAPLTQATAGASFPHAQYSTFQPGLHQPYPQEGGYQEPPQPHQQQASYCPGGLQVQGSQVPNQQPTSYHLGPQQLPQEQPHLFDTYRAQRPPHVRPPHFEWMGCQQIMSGPMHTQGSPRAAWLPQVHAADHRELQYVQASQTAPVFHHDESQAGGHQHRSCLHHEGSPQMQASLQPHSQYESLPTQTIPHSQYESLPTQTTHIQGFQLHPHLQSPQMQAAQLHPGFRRDSSDTQPSPSQGLHPFSHHESSQMQASNVAGLQLCTHHEPSQMQASIVTGLQPCTHHEPSQMQASNVAGLQPCTHHEPSQMQASNVAELQPCPHHESDNNELPPQHELPQMQHRLQTELPPESALQNQDLGYSLGPGQSEGLWASAEAPKTHSMFYGSSPLKLVSESHEPKPSLVQDSPPSHSHQSSSLSMSSGHAKPQSSGSSSPKRSPQLVSSAHSSTTMTLSPSPPASPKFELSSCDQSSVCSDNVVRAHSPTQRLSEYQSSECSYNVAPSSSAHTYTRHPRSNFLGTLQSLQQVEVQPAMEMWDLPIAQPSMRTSSTQFSMEQWDMPSRKPLIEQWDIPSVGSSESVLSPIRRSYSTLQEAFQRKKEAFIRHSKDRQSNLKANALKRQQAIMVQGNYGKGYLKPTIHTAGSTKRDTKRRAKEDLVVRHVTNSDRLISSNQMEPKKFQGAMPVLSSSKREKIKKAEMRERNLKFYSQLPEVKLKKLEEKRVREYEENRKRAKMYQQRILNKMKKSLQYQSKASVKPKTASKPPLPPPFNSCSL